MKGKLNRLNLMRWSVIILFLIGLVTISGSVQARMHMGGIQDRQSLQQGTTIDGPGFFSGDFIQIDGDVNGTTFASGDHIEINGDIDGALFVAGDTVQINGEVTGNKTPVGVIPTKEELNLDGLEIDEKDLDTILSIDNARWRQEMDFRQTHLEQFDRLPEEIWEAHRRVAADLDAQA